jgi:riboflavin kinase
MSTVTATPLGPSGAASSDSSSAATAAAAPEPRPLEPSSNHAVADLAPSLPPPTSNDSSSKEAQVYPTVLSIGYNPYYANTTRSIEIHILHNFETDFYGAQLSLVILGYVRPEYDYVSKEALVEDIREDIRVAQRSLDREAYAEWRGDGWLLGKEGEKEGEKEA